MWKMHVIGDIEACMARQLAPETTLKYVSRRRLEDLMPLIQRDVRILHLVMCDVTPSWRTRLPKTITVLVDGAFERARPC